LERERQIGELENSAGTWDILIVGGGATGLGAALEAVSRGYRTLLLEQHDFAKGTSSRSTKLVHGGVRYLAQGNVPLVMEALRERGLLRQNAPHLVLEQSFVIPCYKWGSVPFYTIGLMLYDLLAGRLSIGHSRPLSREKTLEALPCIRKAGLKGGVRYFDCRFDDARMAVNLVQSVLDQGGSALNYMEVTALLKEGEKVCGVEAVDRESGKKLRIRARAVINATGVFVNRILKMDDPLAKDVVKPSQGIHLVLGPGFMNGSDALMIPRTSDGRVLFVVPWHGKLIVGTTDVEKHHAELEPQAEDSEIDYILETAGRYLDCPPGRQDILSIFTGLRPLAASAGEGHPTKEISRGHKIWVSGSGLVTITGGKWTTYRKMAEDVVNRATRGWDHSARSLTRHLKIHGYEIHTDPAVPFAWYGSDREARELAGSISENIPVIRAQVVWAVRHEMARTVEDFLSRRTRILQLDAGESIRMAPEVARLMARELGRGEDWIHDQVEEYTQLAKGYMLNDE
jgi:glycerol-3-phosphate dehydrogenase